MRFCKFTIQLIIIVALALPVANAQKGSRMALKDKIEGGIFVGASNYSGDIGDYPVNTDYTQLGLGAMIRCNLNNKFSLRVGADYGTITDADSSSTDEFRKRRNLSFKTSILDAYIVGEYYFATIPTSYKKYAQFYLFGGIGTMHFNPQAEYQGVWYNLQPLGTEGQGTQEYPDRAPYQLNQVFIPFGIGCRFTLSSRWYLDVEVRANKTFTDYLDDVSTTYASPDVLLAQGGGPIAVALANRTNEVVPNAPDQTGQPRGNPKNDDWFYYTGFTLCYSFRPKSHCYSF